MPKKEVRPMGAGLPNSREFKVFLIQMHAVISRRLLLLHVRKEACVKGGSLLCTNTK